MKRITAWLLCIIILVCSVAAFSPSGAVFSGSDKVVIVLDPGHGGIDTGTASGSRAEKESALRLAVLIKQKLEANGNFTVYLTRTGDTGLSICDRAIFADSVNADALISIHFDGSTDSSSNGATAYTSVLGQYALIQLGQRACANISSYTGLSSNGVKQRSDTEGYYWNYSKQWDCQDASLGTLSDYYGIPTWSAKFGIPSIILEHGFFSNNHDTSIIFASGGIEKLASADADAIISCYTNHTHTYSAVRQDFASNCMFNGKSSVHCTVCGHRKNVTTLAAAPDNHYWITTESVPAGCGTDGHVTQICRITQNLNDKKHYCTNHTRTTTIPAYTDHDYEKTEDVPATHTVDGYKRYVCKNCGHSFTVPEKAEGHSFEYVSYSEPTCTEAGGSLYRCSVCGDEWLDEKPAVGHSYEQTAYTAPTCTEDGEKTLECTVCGFVSKNTVPATGHSLENEVKTEPTCTVNGVLKGTCSVCGEVVDEEIPATGHSFEVTVKAKPTCTKDGESLSYCTVCGYEEITVIPAAGHKYLTTESIMPDCVSNGKWTGKCSVCGEISEIVTPCTKHKWQCKATRDPGTLTPGQLTYTCKVCGEVRTEKTTPWLFSGGKKLLFVGVMFCAGSAAIMFAACKIKPGRNKSDENCDNTKK